MVWKSEEWKHIQGQVTTLALSFLRNFGLSFSGASGVLGALSAGVGSLAGDDEKERQRERREREITGVGSMMAESGNSIASGFKRGITGLVNKPVQGAKESGVGGAIQKLFLAPCNLFPSVSPDSRVQISDIRVYKYSYIWNI
jgi:hypothetical protein